MTSFYIKGFENKYITKEFNDYKYDFSEAPRHIETLLQLRQITTDGDLISKEQRDYWVSEGMADRVNGFNIINKNGIKHLLEIGAIADY